MALQDSLYLRYAKNDLRRNRGVNVTLVVILILSAFLMGTGAMVMERLVGSVNQLFDQAQPPHFLQMHKGEYDRGALDRFAASQPQIAAWQVEEMVGFDSAAIGWSRPGSDSSGDLSASLIDNLFVVQNPSFDYLIDEDGGIAHPSAGSVYPPVAYRSQFDLRIGDRLSVRTASGVRSLEVAGFVRDAQMASSLSSSTRFLVSPNDFQALREAGAGSDEVIIEYRMTDTAAISGLQRAYEADDALPKNGQAVTYSMIRIINAFSDGLVAIALIFISVVLIAIAMLNLRFVIRGSIEDEVREIGAMKAIGLPAKEISRLYLSKYSALTLGACLIGGLLAVGATRVLTRNIQASYAQAEWTWISIAVPVIALALVYVVVLGICRAVLRSVRRIEVVNALVHGSTLNERQTARRAARSARRARHTHLRGGADLNRRLAMIDLRADGRQWVLIPIVFALAAVLMTLPANLYSTFTSPRFVTYMGAPQSDLRADLQFSEDVDGARAQVLAAMESDTRLTKVMPYANLLFEAEGEEGWETLRVEVGDYTGETVDFVEGRAPTEGQIALSVLNSTKFGAGVGQSMVVRQGSSEISRVVSGIYQDVTSGGYTAKMPGAVTTGAASYVLYADTVTGVDPKVVAEEYSSRFPAAAVIPMGEYVRQTLSYVTNAFRSAALIAAVFGAAVALLITSLFLKLRLTRERRTLGVLSAVGFATREIIGQFRMKVLAMAVIGVLAGTLFAATAGEWLVGGLISASGLGLSAMDFIVNPFVVYALYPAGLMVAAYLGVWALTRGLRSADKSQWLK